MWRLQDLSWRRGLFWLTVFAALLAVGLTLFMASGIYNVAASAAHFEATNRIIEFVLRRSVATHSAGTEVPDLSDDGLVRLGAVHFRAGCAACHGVPGAVSNPIVTHMYPAPPRLDHAALDWKTEELFWIVRHGLKFTGMPSWPGEGRDDEVWALVAFLQRLPEIDGSEFAALAGGSNEAAGDPRFDFGAASEGIALCVDCHGDAERSPVSGFVPTLQGQSADYLRRALVEYGEGLRESGMMEPLAARLSEEAAERIIARYAGMRRLPPPREIDAAAVERGREIARDGIMEGRIPPCLSCHSDTASTRFPRLAGLPQTYIANQLDLFRKGVREQTAYGEIMATIARRLSPAQIDDVAAYFAQARGQDATASLRSRTEAGDR